MNLKEVTLCKPGVAISCDCTLISGDETIRMSGTDQRVSAFMAYRLRVPFVRHKLENCTVVAGARQPSALSALRFWMEDMRAFFS